MRGRLHILCLAAAVAAGLSAGQALAGTFEDDLVAQLYRQGFSEVEVSRTLLGRIRVVATSATVWREIVVNPRTGEILRDYSEDIESDDVPVPTLLNSGSNSGSNSGKGSSGSGSGSGSGSNSGSGSSGSGSGSGSSGGSGSGSGSGSGGGSGGGSDDDG